MADRGHWASSAYTLTGSTFHLCRSPLWAPQRTTHRTRFRFHSACGNGFISVPRFWARSDIGCSVGGSTHLLAQKTDNLVLGIDISLGMIRFAQHALHGQVRYGKRRIGTVYDPVEYAIPSLDSERIDYWVADALSLPFLNQTVDHSQSIHLLDCVSKPTSHLTELIRILKKDGSWSVVCPYDWSMGATEYQHWLGVGY